MTTTKEIIYLTSFLIETTRNCVKFNRFELAQDILDRDLPNVLEELFINFGQYDTNDLISLYDGLEMVERTIFHSSKSRYSSINSLSRLQRSAKQLLHQYQKFLESHQIFTNVAPQEIVKAAELQDNAKQDKNEHTKHERYRLDVATQNHAAVHEWFIVGVAIRNENSPVARLKGLPHRKSGDLQIEWPKGNKVNLRIELVAPDCEFKDKYSSTTVTLVRPFDSPICYFWLRTSKIGQVNIIIRVYQESPTTIELGSIHFMKTVGKQLAGELDLKVKSQKPLHNFPNDAENYISDNEDTEISPEIIVLWAYESAYPLIKTINDPLVKNEVIAALQLFDLEHIDMGLFKLGSLLEKQIKKYLSLLREKNPSLISGKDLGRLVDMINCLERIGVEVDKLFLSILRRDRNTRAHGETLTKIEKQKLFKRSPILGDLYIQYIVSYEQKSQEMSR